MTTIAPLDLPVGGRFTLDELVGHGGMGAVYRAIDLHTGSAVALKLLSGQGPVQQSARFVREAQLLSEIDHPGIVKYIAHGLTPDGTPYLAMEWLEGEDLAQRLTHAALTPAQSVLLLQRVTQALAVAHQRGIIHRDLKPANLFLRGGRLEEVTLLDFGVARRTLRGASGARSQTGLVIGTPEYMAPEQVRGAPDISPRADLFSLGCVLFECLTGEPPFLAEHTIAVLTKILFEDPPLLRQLRPEIPEALEALVSQLLAKDPARRPRDAAALLQQLDALTALPDLAAPISARATPQRTLSDNEQLLLIVLLAREEGATGGTQFLREVLSPYGASTEFLADGSLVSTLLPDERRVATDQAAKAARMALTLREHWPGAAISLSTGRGMLRERMPLGQVTARAAQLLSGHSSLATAPPADPGVLIDEVTAGLLGRRFVVSPLGGGTYQLLGERSGTDELRLVLGKQTPCIGREAELAALDGALSGAIDESVPRVVLLIAPPGAGKSRLRHEFQRRITAAHRPVQILLGCGEPMSAGSPYAMLGQALRGLCGIHDRESLPRKCAGLRARVASHLPAADVQRVAEFLGELGGIPFPEGDSVKLRAARQDPRVMAEQVRLAFADFLRAECAAQPVLLILEDLHWGDALTVQLISSTLRDLAELPLLIFALARPEVSEIFPNLWSGQVQTLPLPGLSRRASERLVHQVLGPQLATQVVARLVEQAAGNALYLEELIRAVGEGKGEQVPGTVLAMLQERIGRLEPGARRVLRAGSVFGENFSVAGVQALIAGEDDEIGDFCVRLMTAEVLEPRRESDDPLGLPQYRFRHALMRDAAYDLIDESDRRLSHLLAGQYLDAAGERDARILAEHAQRSGNLERAANYYAQAARQAYDINDQEGTLRLTAQAVASGVQGEVLGRVRALVALIHIWRWEQELAATAANEAMALTPPGSEAWYQGMTVALVQAGISANADRWHRLLPHLLDAKPDGKALGPCGSALGTALGLASQSGQLQQAHQVQARIGRLTAGSLAPIAQGWILLGQYDYLRHTAVDPGAQLQRAAAAAELLAQAGSTRDALLARTYVGQAQAELGDNAAGEATVRTSLADAERGQHAFAHRHAKIHLAALLGKSPEPEKNAEGGRLASEIADAPMISAGYRGWALCILAQLALDRGDGAAAEALARQALPLLSAAPFRRLWGQALLMQAVRAIGRLAAARLLATQVVTELAALGGGGYVELPVRLAVTETLMECGQTEAACAMLRQAVQRLREIADAIFDPALRQRYLAHIPAHARLIALYAPRSAAE